MATKGRRKRTQIEIARDRAEIKRLRLRYRKTYREIAVVINAYYQEEPPEEDGRLPPSIGFEQVQKELLAAKIEYQEELFSTILDERLDLIRQWEDLAIFCQERYDESCKPKLVQTKESRSNPEKGDSELERELTENTDGNPRYLEIKSSCLKFIAELKGALVPSYAA